MTDTRGYIVQLPKDVYLSVYESLPPACRFVNIEEWKFTHFWVYSPDGQIILFAPVGTIEEREHAMLKGFPDAR